MCSKTGIVFLTSSLSLQDRLVPDVYNELEVVSDGVEEPLGDCKTSVAGTLPIFFFIEYIELLEELEGPKLKVVLDEDKLETLETKVE